LILLLLHFLASDLSSWQLDDKIGVE